MNIVREPLRLVNARGAPEESRMSEYQYASDEFRIMRQKWHFQYRLRSILPTTNATARLLARKAKHRRSRGSHPRIAKPFDGLRTKALSHGVVRRVVRYCTGADGIIYQLAGTLVTSRKQLLL